ncbi:hypothetical protein B7486_46920 [cyanobacterium TDX16]|nr:hypothetical protein B7486_46920 [cyanobacterium TDX16]
MQVAQREVLADGRVRLLVQPVSASYSEEWIVESQVIVERQQLTPARSEKPETAHLAGLTGDRVENQLQPDWEAIAEYESGCIHGKHDAAARIPPICREANCPYSQGYLAGYSSMKADSQPPVQNPKSIDWSVVRDPIWDLYQVWVENRCLLQKATSYEQGESIAQNYIAAEELRSSYRELFIAGFNG